LSYVICVSIDTLAFISTPNINVISLSAKSSKKIKNKKSHTPKTKTILFVILIF